MVAWLWLAKLGLMRLAPAWLSVEGCPELDRDQLEELARLEAGELASEAQANVTCTDEVFVLTVHREGHPASERRVPRGEIEDAPERFLAVELAELIVAAGYGHAEPEPQPAPAPAPPPDRSVPERRKRVGFAFAAARAELGGSPVLPSGGVELGAGGTVWRFVALHGSIAGLGGARSVDGDLVQRGSAHASGWVAFHGVLPREHRLFAGAGVRVGGTWLRGLPRRSQRTGLRHGGATWSPTVAVGIAAPLGERLALVVRLDGGWSLRAVRGLSGTSLVYSSGGPWGGLSVGVGGWLWR